MEWKRIQTRPMPGRFDFAVELIDFHIFFRIIDPVNQRKNQLSLKED